MRIPTFGTCFQHDNTLYLITDVVVDPKTMDYELFYIKADEERGADNLPIHHLCTVDWSPDQVAIPKDLQVAYRSILDDDYFEDKDVIKAVIKTATLFEQYFQLAIIEADPSTKMNLLKGVKNQAKLRKLSLEILKAAKNIY